MKIFTQTCKYSENLPGVTQQFMFANKIFFFIVLFLSIAHHSQPKK